MNGERLRDVLRIAQKAGPARLYSGLASDLAVNLPYSLLYMPVYEELKVWKFRSRGTLVTVAGVRAVCPRKTLLSRTMRSSLYCFPCD